MKNGNLIDLNDLRLLLYVVEHGGFTAASRALGIPTSTISQRIAALERVARTGLLRRTTRSISLTEAGSRLLPHARAIEDLAQEAHQAVSGFSGELTGVLRVTSSPAIAHFALAPVMKKFLVENPKVQVRLDVTNRFVDIFGEGYDVGLRAHSSSLKDSSLLQRVVAHTPWTLAASPDYLEARGVPREPSDLVAHSALYFHATRAEPIWELHNASDTYKVSVTPTMCSDDMASLRVAALDGAGIVGLPTYILKTALASGVLVPLLPDWRVPESIISVVTPPKRQSSRLAKVFTDFVAFELHRLTAPQAASCRLGGAPGGAVARGGVPL